MRPARPSIRRKHGIVERSRQGRAPVAVTSVAIFDNVDDAVLRLGGNDVSSITNGIHWILEHHEARQVAQDRAGEWLEAHNWRNVAERLHGTMTGLLLEG